MIYWEIDKDKLINKYGYSKILFIDKKQNYVIRLYSYNIKTIKFDQNLSHINIKNLLIFI